MFAAHFISISFVVVLPGRALLSPFFYQEVTCSHGLTSTYIPKIFLEKSQVSACLTWSFPISAVLDSQGMLPLNTQLDAPSDRCIQCGPRELAMGFIHPFVPREN